MEFPTTVEECTCKNSYANHYLSTPQNKACTKGFSIFAVLSYLYFVTNNLNNHDNIGNLDFGYGTGLTSGRWFLQILGDCAKHLDMAYNIPIYNITIALVFLLLSTILIIHILRIENPNLCFVLGAITASFPTIASTVFYAFTAHFYFFSILLGTLGVSLALKNKWYRIFAPILFACSMGIYQAYLPFFASLFVLVLIRETMNDESSWLNVVKDALIYLSLLLLGFIVYMVLNKFFLALYHTSLSDYQGVNEMGKLSIRELVSSIKRSYLDLTQLFTNGYRGISPTAILQITIVCILCFSILCCILDWRKRNLFKNLELCILLLLLPLAANSIVIMVPDGNIHGLMLYGMISLFYFPLLVVQNIKASAFIRKSAVIFICLVSLVSALNYSYLNSGNYRSMYYKNQKMENYFAMLLSHARSIEGFNENMEIVFSERNISDDSLHDTLNQNIFRYGVANSGLQIAMKDYRRHNFIYHYFGYVTRDATEEELIQYSSELDEMPSYPNSGSIRIIDDKVFVKCGEN